MVVPVSQIVAIVLSLAGTGVALWLLVTGVRARARILGIIGAVLMLIGTLVDLTYRWAIEVVFGQVSDAELIMILSARIVIGSVLTGAGIVLLSSAIVLSGGFRRREPAR